jgi:hypothetical protein
LFGRRRFRIICSGKEWGRHSHLHGVFCFENTLYCIKAACITGGVVFALYPGAEWLIREKKRGDVVQSIVTLLSLVVFKGYHRCAIDVLFPGGTSRELLLRSRCVPFLLLISTYSTLSLPSISILSLRLSAPFLPFNPIFFALFLFSTNPFSLSPSIFFNIHRHLNRPHPP